MTMIHCPHHRQWSLMRKLWVTEVHVGLLLAFVANFLKFWLGAYGRVLTCHKSYWDLCFMVYITELIYCRVSCSITICIVPFFALLPVISTLFIRREAVKWRGGPREAGVDTYLVSTWKLCNCQDCILYARF